MNTRNPKHNPDGSIDCEVEHPEYGWIPFTARAGDSEGDRVLARIAADGTPVAAVDLAKLKAAKIAALDADRQRIETLPIQGNNGGTLFKISRPEKINEFLMGGLSIALDPSPTAKFTMFDDDGVEVEYSKVLMGQIIRFINSSKAPALGRYAVRKAAIDAAATEAEVNIVETDLTKP